MSKLRFVGLDVHKDSTVIAVAEAGAAPAVILKRIPSANDRLLAELKRLAAPGELQVCYEAGPTGFGLARFLRKAGVDCLVVAPSLVPKTSGCRVKTDRRDARKLAHFLRSGDLTPVWIPDEHTEALREVRRVMRKLFEKKKKVDPTPKLTVPSISEGRGEGPKTQSARESVSLRPPQPISSTQLLKLAPDRGVPR